jgi:hypothetical protein
MIFLQGFITFDLGISEKCVGQTFGGRKKERKKKKKKNNKKRSKHNMSHKLRLGDIITVFQSKYTTVFVLLDISESK